MTRLLECERALKASGTAGAVLFRKLMTDIAHQALGRADFPHAKARTRKSHTKTQRGRVVSANAADDATSLLIRPDEVRCWCNKWLPSVACDLDCHLYVFV